MTSQSQTSPVRRFDARAIEDSAARLFRDHGMPEEMAATVARTLVLADRMGHHTHGLAIASWYFDEIANGNMALEGEPTVLSDRGACVAWQGHRLPGPWLVSRAVGLGIERAREFGQFTLTIAESHHTGALLTYLPAATDLGLMAYIACSGPAHQGVAPFGGTRGVFTPNPFAAGLPTRNDPILIDTSCSITTIKRSTQLARAGKTFESDWLLDSDGLPSRDPNVLLSGNGTLLPVGGLDHGHKGYALALLVEAQTQGLSGRGRRNELSGVPMNSYIQITDPSAFGGADAYLDEMSWLKSACENNPPRPSVAAVRVPGSAAMTCLRESDTRGVALSAATVSDLKKWARAGGLSLPDPLE